MNQFQEFLKTRIRCVINRGIFTQGGDNFYATPGGKNGELCRLNENLSYEKRTITVCGRIIARRVGENDRGYRVR